MGKYVRASFSGCRVLAFVVGAFLTPMAEAGSAAAGTLGTIHFFSDGTVLVSTSGTRTTPPACATQLGRFAVNSATAGGKSQLAGLLAAYSTGKDVVILGTGDCGIYGDTESIDYFYTIDP